MPFQGREGLGQVNPDAFPAICPQTSPIPWPRLIAVDSVDPDLAIGPHPAVEWRDGSRKRQARCEPIV